MRAAVVVVAACASLAALAPQAWACNATARGRAVEAKSPHGPAPLIIGDSTMILAAPKLGRRGIEADARGCRQFDAGVAMLAARRRAGRLPRVAILALGANGPVASRSIARALRIMGRRRVLGLVTPRNSAATGAAMRAAARRHPNRVLLIDWAAFSAGRSWFAGDGLHVTYTGAQAFADLVRRRVAPLVAPPLRALRLPRRPDRAAKRCGGVYVIRGSILCSRARQLAGLPLLRPIAGWRAFAVDIVRGMPWQRAYLRRDGRVVVATRAPRAAAAAGNPLRVLATGDSMMLLTDRMLARTLAGRAIVMRDVRVATGLTKPYLIDWHGYAGRQAERRRPDVVVMAMGANDGFRLRGARCCKGVWIDRYARQVERVARAWRVRGVRAVYWLTLPAPVPGFLTPRFQGVNAAVERAASITMIDTRPILTPQGRFVSEAETSPGVVEKIRSDDGVHLWWPGARLVAQAIVARMEADGLLSPAA